MTERESLFSALWRFLFESELPAALQVFWKALTFTMAGLGVYIATMYASQWAQAAWCLYATFFVIIGIFVKLGHG